MDNIRFYGTKPYKIALVHGGPGALGDMGYLSELLSEYVGGVIEPLQTKSCIDELVEELADVLENSCEEPIILIGHSWGGLGYLIYWHQKDLNLFRG